MYSLLHHTISCQMTIVESLIEKSVQQPVQDPSPNSFFILDLDKEAPKASKATTLFS